MTTLPLPVRFLVWLLSLIAALYIWFGARHWGRP